MHDMGKTLHIHAALQVHAAGLGHPPEVIAPQIHQHHMLGLFLGVTAQFLRQPGIFQIVPATAPRPGDGRQLQAAFLAAHHDFRRGPPEAEVCQPHEEHVGRGIIAAHTPVEHEGIPFAGHGKIHGRHHLYGLALMQHGLDLFHHGLVAGFPGIGADVAADAEAAFRIAAAPYLAVFAQADLAQPIVQMVEDQLRPGQHQHAFRLFRRHDRGQAGLEQGGHAEAHPAVKGAGDGRKAFDLRRGLQVQALHQAAQAFHKRQALQNGKRGKACILDAQVQPPFAAADIQGHIAGKDAVAPPAAVHLRAFQQDAVLPAHHAQIKADGRIHVGGQPAGLLPQGDKWSLGSRVGRSSGIHKVRPSKKKRRSPWGERRLLNACDVSIATGYACTSPVH